jgi:hypothetical protein
MTRPPTGEDAPAPAGRASPPRRRLGCWGLGAITCGSLFLIFAVFLGTVLWILRPYLADIWTSGQLSARCVQNLQAIHGALDRYRTARGAYPARLTDLLPEYLSRAQVLHCPADSRPSVVTSYRYTPPATTSPGEPATPIVTCDHHELVIKGHRAVNAIEMMPDGSIRQKTTVYDGETPAPAGGTSAPRGGGG